MSEDVVLRPLGDKVVVKPIEKEEKTPSGIFLPDTAKDKPQQGKVVAVGPGRWNDKTGERTPLDVKIGDTVIFAKYAGTEVKLDDTKYLIMGESDVLAIVDKG